MSPGHPAGEPGEPVVVPCDALSDEAMQGLIQSFVLREGTEYGWHDVPLATKVAQVREQLRRGDARVVFDPASETVDIVPAPRVIRARPDPSTP